MGGKGQEHAEGFGPRSMGARRLSGFGLMSSQAPCRYGVPTAVLRSHGFALSLASSLSALAPDSCKCSVSGHVASHDFRALTDIKFERACTDHLHMQRRSACPSPRISVRLNSIAREKLLPVMLRFEVNVLCIISQAQAKLHSSESGGLQLRSVNQSGLLFTALFL